ncbi:hypothetical protein [Cohnella thailandensis]|uniref:Uncharacterized protein n=1 Tax=Cohnella thailandensis TaxID=557557 RepID=A0A841SRQ9_9BACL|nr:hypothetical protein [Cohnella thailandensis]MBB6633619.1 hypothetical protein [Cohnella thailandensis]MBP1976403.1 hypothetical protein [Cohnella thailandensis]
MAWNSLGEEVKNNVIGSEGDIGYRVEPSGVNVIINNAPSDVWKQAEVKFLGESEIAAAVQARVLHGKPDEVARVSFKLMLGGSTNAPYRVFVDPLEGKVIGQQKGALPPNATVDVVPEKSNDYAIDANGTFLALQDWSDEVDLEKILGSPTSGQSDILTNADTLNGSSTKYITYDGLDIELFSPSQEEDRFWILSMKLTKDRYSTSRGISVGDSVSDLKAAYPDIQLAPDGRTDENNGAYLMSDGERYNRLWFEVAEGEITEIRIYHEIP